MENIIEIRNLYKKFAHSKGVFKSSDSSFYALNNISLDIQKNEIMALVGASGSGKSTLANCILNLIKPDSGEILFNGKNIFKLDREELKLYRRNVQLIFQNPYSSLNPKMKVFDILEEPLIIYNYRDKTENKKKIYEIIDKIGFSKTDLMKFPFEFSGGQRQRIAIARALILNPKFIVADEPTSALDVSIQAQIINLLLDLKKEFDITYLFISHNLNLVRFLADRVCILNSGTIEEFGTKEEIFENPKKEYTKELISSLIEI